MSLAETLATDLIVIVEDRPTQITRTRKTHTDKMRSATEISYGPFIARVEKFKATRNAVTFDEKGTAATTACILVGVHVPDKAEDPDDLWHLPREVEEDVPLFKVGDALVDSDGNKYRVTSPAYWTGNCVEVNIELLG